jgi:hypothetical protein
VTYTHSTFCILYVELSVSPSLSLSLSLSLCVMEERVFEKEVSKKIAFGPWE